MKWGQKNDKFIMGDGMIIDQSQYLLGDKVRVKHNKEP